MTEDSIHWWPVLPPCVKCRRPHVLIDCPKRLPWELDGASAQAETAA